MDQEYGLQSYNHYNNNILIYKYTSMIDDTVIFAAVNQIKPMYETISNETLVAVLKDMIAMIENENLSRQQLEQVYIFLINDCGMSSSPSIPFSQSAGGVDCVGISDNSLMLLDEDESGTDNEMLLNTAKQLLFCIELT
jgi:hypothetical protein